MHVTGAHPGIFYFGGGGGEGGVETFVQKGLLNVFVANCFSQRRPRVFSICERRSPLARGNTALRTLQAEANRS